MSRPLAFALFLLSACSPDAPQAGAPGSALEVVADGPNEPIPVGTRAPVVFRLKNAGDAPVWVLGSLDGSWDGSRFPKCLVEIRDEAGVLQEPEIRGVCGFMDPLTERQFVQLKPKETLAQPLSTRLAFWKPTRPGTYTVRMTYDTSDPTLSKWGGTAPTVNARTRELQALVPKGKVVSNTVTVRVVAP